MVLAAMALHTTEYTPRLAFTIPDEAINTMGIQAPIFFIHYIPLLFHRLYNSKYAWSLVDSNIRSHHSLGDTKYLLCYTGLIDVAVVTCSAMSKMLVTVKSLPYDCTTGAVPLVATLPPLSTLSVT